MTSMLCTLYINSLLKCTLACFKALCKTLIVYTFHYWFTDTYINVYNRSQHATNVTLLTQEYKIPIKLKNKNKTQSADISWIDWLLFST